MNLGWIWFFNIWHWRGGVADSFAIHWRSPGVEEWHFIPLIQISNCNSTEWSPICNGNWTDWSPIRFVIIRVINKIGRPRSGSPICLITVWLQTELDDTKFRYQLIITLTKFVKKGPFFYQHTRNSKFFCWQWKKKAILACAMAHTVQLLRHNAYCPIKLSY